MALNEELVFYMLYFVTVLFFINFSICKPLLCTHCEPMLTTVARRSLINYTIGVSTVLPSFISVLDFRSHIRQVGVVLACIDVVHKRR